MLDSNTRRENKRSQRERKQTILLCMGGWVKKCRSRERKREWERVSGMLCKLDSDAAAAGELQVSFQEDSL